jgi:hypothetical protein
MKKIYNYVLGALLFAGGMTSCGEDFLEVDHYGVVEPAVLLTTQEYVEQGLNGVYDLLYPERGSGSSDISSGWLLKPHMAMSNYPALDIQPDGWDVAFSRQAWTTSQAEFEGGWTRAYNTIDRANRFLANLQNADPNIFQGGETTMKLIEAQARALRAYFYTFLVQNFGGVPLLKTGETYSTHPGKERGTTEEAWNMIIEDLEFARDQLDWQPWKGEKGRVTKGMAKAYLAQAYMYNKRFADAKKELKDIIDSNIYSLNPCFGQIHLPGYYWQPESIWEIAFPEAETMGWGADATSDSFWWPAQLKGNKEYGGWGPHYVSYEFCWSFEPGDKRLQYEVARYGEKNPFVLKQTEDDPTLYLPPNWVQQPWGQQNMGGMGPEFGTVGLQPGWRSAFITSDVMPNNSDMKLWKTHIAYQGREYDPLSSIQIRLAAIYLSYAECCFETEGPESAEGWSYIQKIRDRAWGANEVGMSQDVMPGISGSFYKNFPFELNQDASVKAPDGRTFYANYKRAPGKIGGKAKKLVGGDQLVPIYEDAQYQTSYEYKPYTSPAWKVALVIERRHEFFAEYSLWYDICRMGMAQEYLDAEYPQNSEALVRQSIPGYTDKGFSDEFIPNPHTIRSYAHNPSRELYPIPKAELDKNPALSENDQNPGY